MKAAVFYGKNDLRIEEIEKPVPRSDEVLVKVMACGICGTDVHIFHGDEGAAPTPAGTVLGHEFSGIVESVGRDVTAVKPGDKVCVDPNKLCGECDYCRGGMGHFCEHITGIGTTVNGGFAEYCAVPVSQVYKFEKAGYNRAAMTEPLACCLHGIDRCNISCGDTVLIIGGGMIGMLMLQLAKMSGAGKVILSEPVEEKRRQAEKLGADLCIDSVKEDLRTALKRADVGRIATVIECVGRKETMSQAIEVAGNKATVMLFGLTSPGEKIELSPFDIFKKELTVTASYINPYTQGRALTLIENGKTDVSSMVYRTVSLTELPGILADGKERAKGKIIVVPGIGN